MNEPDLSDAALAELLTLTVAVDGSGTMRYCNQQGQRHRIHGPAVTYLNGGKFWYQNDRLHRTDGPAVIYPNGKQRWFLNWEELTEYDFNERTRSL